MRYPVLASPARPFAVAALLAALAGGGAAVAQEVDYSRAERFLTWNTERMIAGAEVVPTWMETGDSDRFWYRNNTGSGYEFVMVDPAAGSREPLFDHYRLAGAMSLANDTSYVPDQLPFSIFSFGGSESEIEFTANDRRFTCDIAGYACTVGDTLTSRLPFVESPDGRWEAFSHEYDLYVRPAGGGDSIRLTSDGEKHYAYGYNEPRPNQERQGPGPRTPTLAWSPDSRYIAVARRDERDVEHMHYISYTSQRPRHFSQPYALPGDSVIPLPTVHIVELEEAEMAAGSGVGEDGDGAGAENVPAPRAAANRRVEVAPVPHQLSFAGSAPDSAWSADGTRLHVNYFTRGSQRVFLAEIDAATGSSRVILGDSTRTFVSLGHRGGGSSGGTPSWYVSEGGDDVIWWSERDGWAHLYRFDGQGNLRNRITSGPWTVGQAVFIDEARQRIYFTARGREPGRNPYYAHLYRVGFNGSELTLLTPEDANHVIEFSPSGSYFVDTYSRVEGEPVTVLRTAADGRVVRELERADISAIEEIGFIPGEVFTAKARDGITDLYGILYLPPDLDENAKYPIISHIYPGPQRGSVGDWEFKGGGENFALAQLGFVVVQIDHLGTPHRSKAFHDNYYGNFIDNGIPDHIAVIRQLAARHPFIDLDRVGIYGHSGGGFASTDAILRFPEFFKVAVSGAGNHDNRSYNIYWAEKYQGVMEEDSTGTDNFEASANKTYAANLEGKLLLMHGDMDDNVHPAMTVQVIDELIKANRDFDLIWAPDRAHGLNEPYFIRRRWDYFVRHLLGAEPPPQYEIVRPEG
ncbi:MAG: DPP IV N-terminal domain-containing protein [Gammaproteobacteria bacterium]|nr:DPP IV N-terminal domain-containing protein [Gammaproteobacteria bacterium]MDE0257019.1 DPP IV N-terminal domain-containing protein [Gammaproteobacteria bacterium]